MKSVSVATMIPAMGTAMGTMTGTMMVIRRAMQIYFSADNGQAM